MTEPMLFTPIDLRAVSLRNRIVISPMCTYSAEDGIAQPWHMVHLGQFALGGAAAVFTEAASVTAQGRITHGDLGIWSDAHADALKPVAAFIKAQGAVPAIQLAHAGRKASRQRPWFGNGPLGDADLARGDHPWPITAPSAEPFQDSWLVPEEASLGDIRNIVEAFAAAAGRSLAAGFEMLEIHGAHGYLLHSFLSPLANRRADAYGGDPARRMRMALEVADAVRAVWPDDRPLFFRVSSVDGADGGRTIEDSIALARELKRRGVDVIDCSSGGVVPKESINAHDMRHGPGLHVPFADAIRRQAEIQTMAVGLILDGPQAEQVIRAGKADLVAIARTALDDPYWPLHQMQAMGVDPEFERWPRPYGWWLVRRAKGLTVIPARS